VCHTPDFEIFYVHRGAGVGNIFSQGATWEIEIVKGGPNQLAELNSAHIVILYFNKQ